MGIKVINRLETPGTYHLMASSRLASAPSHLRFPEESTTFTLTGGQALIINTVVEADAASFVNGAMPITISIVDSKGEAVAERRYNLQGPMRRFDADDHKSDGPDHRDDVSNKKEDDKNVPRNQDEKDHAR